MANEKTRRSSKSADYGSVIMLTQLQQQRYTKDRRNFRQLARAKEKIFIDSKLMLQEKGNNKDQIDTEHQIHRTFTSS